jgi:hypothetical protein
MHAENSYEMSKYFTRTNKIQLLNSLMVCMILFMYVSLKQYTKVDFPPDSKFKQPKHLSNETWAVMHITGTSKEVVAGYIEDDIFYIIFLDKEHEFWPSSK